MRKVSSPVRGKSGDRSSSASPRTAGGASWGLVASLGVIYFGLPADAPRAGLTTPLPPLDVLEGMGALFGSLAELMPEEQTTLAGILRLWAGHGDRRPRPGRPGVRDGPAAVGVRGCLRPVPGRLSLPHRRRYLREDLPPLGRRSRGRHAAGGRHPVARGGGPPGPRARPLGLSAFRSVLPVRLPPPTLGRDQPGVGGSSPVALVAGPAPGPLLGAPGRRALATGIGHADGGSRPGARRRYRTGIMCRVAHETSRGAG